jgi:arginyl-tRNA synthetase
MKKIIDLITEEMTKAFVAADMDARYAKVTISNRPDLCEYQCNGAMAAAKEYKKAPFIIAGEVVAQLGESEILGEATVVNPGFINLKIKDEFLARYLHGMKGDENLSVAKAKSPKTIIVDYGGPNVAKPLHIGHLRSAIIGESIKRTGRYLGHKMIGDIHLGDWGLQMGLIITELRKRQPKLAYFDDEVTEYPSEAPFTIGELEEIYPCASEKSKTDEAYREEALEATKLLQQGKSGYRALWEQIMKVSKADLEKNYEKLNVDFDLWKGEADVQKYIPDMIAKMKADGDAYLDDGALVVDIKKEDDTKEMPPCMLLKSDGASLYTTTDLATLVERMELFQPDEIIYVVDKRQGLHFEQVFRCARKTKLIGDDVDLFFLGFGTMNGADGKPFKTRDGGVMRLEYLLNDISEEMYKKISENRNVKESDAKDTAEMVGLAAVKYGDLSNQAAKDYVFDIERFTSFEGNTGPYILYTIVRIKSILSKYAEEKKAVNTVILPAANESEKALMLEVVKFNSVVENAFEEKSPHKICAYVYDLSNAFNRFYHETKILSEEDEARKASWIQLLELVQKVLETSIELLGFKAPERM